MSAEGPIEYVSGGEDVLAAFRREIAEFKAKEVSHDLPTANFLEINVDELADADRVMWERVKDFSRNPVSLAEFDVYRMHTLASSNRSRTHFVAFLANKLTPLIVGEDLRRF